MKKNLTIIGATLLTTSLYGGFDFGGNGGGCEGGTGDPFKQEIQYSKTVTVGSIIKDLKDVKISLKSDNDVDVQLYDEESGKALVGWNIGALIGNDAGYATTTYKGMTIEYSGYNGDGTGTGHEYIRILGTIPTNLIMKAFGYKAGYSIVDYSWGGKENCTQNSIPSASGSKTFQQQIPYQDVVELEGTIPTGINDLYISLKSDNDIDVQLFDKDSNKPLVGWNIGALIGNDAGYATTTYKGMTMEYSGYNGDGTGVGHEYIRITGATSVNLIMKAYGYKSGYAKIDYSWGNSNSAITSVEATPISGKSYAESNEDINFKVLTTGDNIKVYIHFFDGDKYLPKDEMSGGNGVWTFTRAIKNPGNRKYKVTLEKSDGSVLKSHEAYIEVKKSSAVSLSTMNDYVAKYTNQCIDMDGSYGCQCMDLMHHYVDKILGIPRSVSLLKSAGPDAIYYTTFNNKTSITMEYGTIKVRLDKISNTSTSVPKVGDIIIWKKTSGNGYYGHVGMFISGDANQFKSIDQNWHNPSLTKGSPAKIVTHNYDNVVGYLRPVLLSH